ncbi:MAG: 4-hydroxy-3-methylbut-2-enyl diphosphate reductase [Burkholderiaceae bacterium]|nr:4-hydroxy-3-methylbut-2-enyl diphosphate reductase [Sulfuritalea sp.]MCF8174676.1 4-hydroxy-3-methylbut-2-enyl diphosphate reductase [Burkholderiaceae bacterium]MCF8184787.1 4-hydroxy-3-methylbut-2-enyl diphosphate reductase [Polynucleobacter sp.]
MNILLANPRGFCAGVERAIAIVERALEKFGAPIYVRHEVVHNRYVVDGLKAKGAIFVEELAEVPDGATVVFSAHGVPQAVRLEAAERGLKVFDATCPLVTKVHLEVARLHKQGYEIVMIGHKGHPEVEGTMGQATGRMHLVENVADVGLLKVPDGTHSAGAGELCIPGIPLRGQVTAKKTPLAYVTQTTLSVDDARIIVHALHARFPDIIGPRKDDICYATQNRQDAVKAMAGQVDVMVVVGSKNSSNSNRLREVAAIGGIPAYLVDGAEQIEAQWLEGRPRVGVTAGASAPEILVNGVVERLQALGAGSIETLDGVAENVNFPLPKELLI